MLAKQKSLSDSELTVFLGGESSGETDMDLNVELIPAV